MGARTRSQEARDPEPIDGFDPLSVADEFGLTTKRAMFCEWYLITMNQTKAATKAGFATPVVEGSRLMSDANVRRYLDYRFAQRKVTPNWLLDKLRAIADADISDYLIVDPQVAELQDGVMKLTQDGRVLDGIWFDLKRALKDGNTGVIKAYKRVRGETVLELEDKIKAIELLGKHYRLFADVTITPPNGDIPAEALPDTTLETIARQGLAAGADQASGDVLLPADEPLFDDT